MKDHYWELAEQLRGENGYPYEMMPLLYAIIKAAKGNFPEANKLIQEGKNCYASHTPVPQTDSANCDSEFTSTDDNDKGNTSFCPTLSKSPSNDVNTSYHLAHFPLTCGAVTVNILLRIGFRAGDIESTMTSSFQTAINSSLS